jgi:hypothetical protein
MVVGRLVGAVMFMGAVQFVGAVMLVRAVGAMGCGLARLIRGV